MVPLLFLVLMVACGNLVELLRTSSRVTPAQKRILKLLPKRSVIAHRGTTYWAPEETEAAMRWARNTGADYLEFDLQRTKDGFLIAIHDDNLLRTTDIDQKFPDRKNLPVSSFTYAELMTLDAGTWFNKKYPGRAKPSFSFLDILTLEDIVQIAEGKRIKRDENGKRIHTTINGTWTNVYEHDPMDNGNRPGIYIETKVPDMFPGIEEDLKRELIRLEWQGNKKAISTQKGKVSTANTDTRVILQTFSKESLKKLHANFGDSVPICFLLWLGIEPDDLPEDIPLTYKKHVESAISNGASIIGPSISGEPNNYSNLLTPQHAEIIHETGAYIHAYSFDTKKQLLQFAPIVDGVFSNKSEEALLIYKHQNTSRVDSSLIALQTLRQLGY